MGWTHIVKAKHQHWNPRSGQEKDREGNKHNHANGAELATTGEGCPGQETCLLERSCVVQGTLYLYEASLEQSCATHSN